MTTIDSNLMLASDASVKSWRARLKGTVLAQSSSTGSGKPRETTKSFPSESDAIEAFHKAVHKKMTEGFALVRNVGSAEAGDVVLDLLAPDHSSAEAFDLSLDGSTIALGTTLKEAHGAQIHLVDVCNCPHPLNP